MEISDIESYTRPPNTMAVLSDLLEWQRNFPNQAYAELVDWKTLDFGQIRKRLETNRFAKPRIELSAEITKMNNLSVRWHPGGWRDTAHDWSNRDHDFGNLITRRKWRQPPDFHWFSGDEEPTFNSRASNELMYIRGVGNLCPEPREYGPFTYNRDVVHSILICAVRNAYERLIEQLQRSFEVKVLDGFDFEVRDEIDETDIGLRPYPIHRVVGWSLEDAEELQARRERLRATEEEQRDRAELANVAQTYGFTLEAFAAAVAYAASKKPTGPSPTAETINRNAAKHLRIAGFQIDAGKIRRIRELLERYNVSVAEGDAPDINKITVGSIAVEKSLEPATQAMKAAESAHLRQQDRDAAPRIEVQRNTGSELRHSRLTQAEWNAVRRLQRGKQPNSAGSKRGVEPLMLRGFIEKIGRAYRLTEAGLKALEDPKDL
jgi:hypothetical protein